MGFQKQLDIHGEAHTRIQVYVRKRVAINSPRCTFHIYAIYLNVCYAPIIGMIVIIKWRCD